MTTQADLMVVLRMRDEMTKALKSSRTSLNDFARVLTLADYRGLTSINRDDLVLFNEAEAQRTRDEWELERGKD